MKFKDLSIGDMFNTKATRCYIKTDSRILLNVKDATMKPEDIELGHEYQHLSDLVKVISMSLMDETVDIETRFGEQTTCDLDELTPKPAPVAPVAPIPNPQTTQAQENQTPHPRRSQRTHPPRILHRLRTNSQKRRTTHQSTTKTPKQPPHQMRLDQRRPSRRLQHQ